MAKKMKTMDGNTATTHIAYALSDVAVSYTHLTLPTNRLV